MSAPEGSSEICRTGSAPKTIVSPVPLAGWHLPPKARQVEATVSGPEAARRSAPTDLPLPICPYRSAPTDLPWRTCRWRLGRLKGRVTRRTSTTLIAKNREINDNAYILCY